MLILKISIDIYGDNLNTNAILNIVQEEIYIEKDTSEDIKGWLTFIHPEIFGVEYKLKTYQEWYVSIIEKYYKYFTLYGATEVNIFYDVFYSKQCNFEIMSDNLMKRLGEYSLSYPISVYKVNDIELKDMLFETGRSKNDIDKIFKNE